MEHAEVHVAIREVFGLTHVESDNLPVGSSMRYTRGLFPKLFSVLGYQSGAEIGVRFGRFTKKICDANPDMRWWAIDPWVQYGRHSARRQEKRYQSTLKLLRPYKVGVVREESLVAVRKFEPGSLDCVYIDGSHTFDDAMRDIIEWSYIVRSGGIVAVHDYYAGATWQGVVPAVDAYTRAHHIDPWYVTKEVHPTAYWVKP